MAGSSRSRSLSWIARHSARLRAPIPGGSKVWIRPSAASISAGATWRRGGDLGQVLGEISGLVEAVDQVLGRCRGAGDRPSRDRAVPPDGSARLVAWASIASHFRLELAVAGAGRLPGGGRRRPRCGTEAGPAPSADPQPPPAASRAGNRRGSERGASAGGFAFLQERIALEFGLHIGRKLAWESCSSLIDCSKLRSHRQGLALAQLQPLHRTHERIPDQFTACFLHASVVLPCRRHSVKRAVIAIPGPAMRSEPEILAEIEAAHVLVRDDLVRAGPRSARGRNG